MHSFICILFAVSLAVLLGGLYVQWKKGQRLEERIKSLQSDMSALSLGALGMSQHLDAMSQKQQKIIEQQATQRASVPLVIGDVEKLYQSAIVRVKEGASVDELISQCHLAREEAELIKMIHSLDQKQTK
ncbi:MAG: DUF2802 domain-containing protein [Gammaproteobacteria bacterium]|nr:DUF2802 domain-containing protein [Gammaproteobacteria bacterium]